MQTFILPVAVFPGSANVLYIHSITLGPPPSYYYELRSVDAQNAVTVVKNGNVNMTPEQWNDWWAGLCPDGDTEYQLNCIAANLGLTRA